MQVPLMQQDQRAAASLLGVVLAKRPSIADFLVAEGALAASVQLLLKGGSASTPRLSAIRTMFVPRKRYNELV